MTSSDSIQCQRSIQPTFKYIFTVECLDVSQKSKGNGNKTNDDGRFLMLSAFAADCLRILPDLWGHHIFLWGVVASRIGNFYSGVVLNFLGSVTRRRESWRDWLVLKFLTRRKSLRYTSSEKRSARATSWGSMSVLARISITENAGSKKSSRLLQPISESIFWPSPVCRITFIYCSGRGQTLLQLGTILKLRCVGGSCARPEKSNWKSMENGTKCQLRRPNST